MSSRKRVQQRKLRSEALKSFQEVLEAEQDIHTTLFTFEMSQHKELVKAWEADELPKILEAADARTLDGQKEGLRDLLIKLAREREVALQFLFEFDTPHDWAHKLRDEDEREVLIKHLYRSKYRLGGERDFAREWGRLAIMSDADIYVIRVISASLFKDATDDDWFTFYSDALARMVFHSHEAALAAEKGREYEPDKLVRAYEKLLDRAEADIRKLKDFSFSRLEFERSVLERKGRPAHGLDEESGSAHEGRPSVYLGT